VLLPSTLKSEDARVKAGLQQLLRTLLAHHPALCAAAGGDLLLALLHLRSSPQAPEVQAAKLGLDSEGLLQELAAICAEGNVDTLLARHRPQLIAQVGVHCLPHSNCQLSNCAAWRLRYALCSCSRAYLYMFQQQTHAARVPSRFHCAVGHCLQVNRSTLLQSWLA
jgi:hypothetical protein